MEQIIDVTADPRQEFITLSPIHLHVRDYNWTVRPRAHYWIAARVLSHAIYNNGWQSMLSPMDLALGWGIFADRKADQWVEWTQTGRWYFYHWTPDSPYNPDDIGSHSANVHIIPANDQVKSALQYVRNNDAVFLEGWLVDVDGSNGDRIYGWRTSLSRNDTGDGACEILYLNRIIVNGIEYQPDRTVESVTTTVSMKK